VTEAMLDRDDGKVVLILQGIAGPDAAESPLVRVFAEDPAISPDASPSGPNHVATFAFFGTDAQEATAGSGAGHGQGHGAHGGNRFSFALELTPTLRRLRRRGRKVGSAFNVQIVLAPLKGRNPPKQTEIAPTEVEVAVF
jgi:hypothetical protein